jgi:hypothetical protein
MRHTGQLVAFQLQSSKRTFSKVDLDSIGTKINGRELFQIILKLTGNINVPVGSKFPKRFEGPNPRRVST